MITYDEAFRRVMLYAKEYGVESVPLLKSNCRVLAETIHADRDFPPFHRATKDGIAINFSSFENGTNTYKIEAVVGAGMPQSELQNTANCLEIMTGAVLPQNTDTIIMYEDIEIKDGFATILSVPEVGQNIHIQGADKLKGTALLEKGLKITPAEIGILASVGKRKVRVTKLPKVLVISTGNELVAVSETPKPHQIRTSNVISLQAALSAEHVSARHMHISDNKKTITKKIKKALKEHDVLLLSGGVSKGKFDFIPEVMDDLGVEKVFHKVLQRPGKPFWFGIHDNLQTLVFSFPGNPVSTFVNYHSYFLPWFKNSIGIGYGDQFVKIDETVSNNTGMMLFHLVKTYWENGSLYASIIANNGSGDLTSLSEADGFICLPHKDTAYEKEALVVFVGTK
ncbi:molybdopterin molybdotransferase MoeA [Cellulophaga sp. Hel_I_12]|uniref:molybdopterin molybdotransferase MoeA n=1 Tax=Cellulophaga sp. Hel_I_12 TaxID=1249972 RepID=UPI0006459EE0|nr:molybdopterin molybdotransferase MoeA [Cellulophaga sp. Hel_I_12]